MKKSSSMAEKWLWLGVCALGLAGLYSLVPVVGRTPQLKSLGVMQQLFDVALVVHVDLSVMVWSFAMLGMALAQLMQSRRSPFAPLQQASFYAVAVSAVVMALSPLDAWVAVKSNYIPVLHNGTFMLSLGLLMSGMLALVLPPLLHMLRRGELQKLDITEIGWISAAFVALLGLAGYALGGYLLPPIADLHDRYEMLFWAGGHIMQFSFTLMAMAAWLSLLAALGGDMPNRRLVLCAFAITILCAMFSSAGFVLYPFDTSEFTQHQTRVMNELGGIGASLVAVLLFLRLLRTPITRPHRAYGSALIVSFILFYAGGALGLMISGQNVTIPAHYHGMIVGITQALMGLAYVMLPRFGYASVATTRLAFWQPVIYGLGQIMHIGGLAYCGGYGILRKTAGGFEGLAPDIKIALGIFGLGGLLAIIGGILFVVVMLRARARRGLETSFV